MRLRNIVLLSLLAGPSTFSQLIAGEGRLPTPKQVLRTKGVNTSQASLIVALRDSRPEVRYLAAQVLAEAQIRQALPAISASLRRESDKRARTNIAFALAQLRSPLGFNTLGAICLNKKEVWSERLLASRYLSNLDDKRCTEVVIQALDSNNEAGYRIEAMYMVQTMSILTPEARKAVVGSLREGLFDREQPVRIAASSTLVALKDRDSVPYLERAISKEADDMVRERMNSDLTRLLGVYRK